jgi:tricorn protease
VYIVVLRKDLPSPLEPLSDEEGEAKTDAVKTDAAKLGGQEKEKEKPPAAVKVDFEKIGQRILAMPIPARNYTELKTGKEGVLFLVEGPLVEPLSGPATLTAHRFELKTRKTDKLIENILAFHVSADGEKLLYRHASAPQPGGTAPTQVWAIRLCLRREHLGQVGHLEEEALPLERRR